MLFLSELVGIAEDGYDIAPVIPQMVRMGMAQYNAIKAGLYIIITPEKALVTTMTKKENPLTLRCMMEPVIQINPAYVFRDNDSIVHALIKRRQECCSAVFGVYYQHNQSIFANIAV